MIKNNKPPLREIDIALDYKFSLIATEVHFSKAVVSMWSVSAQWVQVFMIRV